MKNIQQQQLVVFK